MGKYFRKTARWNGRKYEGKGKTELEAITRLAEKLAAAKRGEEVISGSMTVSTWYEKWKNTYKDPAGLTKKSLGMYDEKFDGYIRPAIGTMKLQDVRDVHLQRILNGQAGRSRSHVEKIRRVLREMFRQAKWSRLIPYDPTENLKLPACTQHARRSLTDPERALLLQVCQCNPWGLWFQLLLYTGMRPGEAAALNWADVDFKNNEIHVHAALESGSSQIKGPKTAAGVRDIPIHPDLLPLLLEAKGAPFEPVFKTNGGERMNHGAWDRAWKSCKRAMNLALGAKTKRNQLQEDKLAPDLTPYCLRHTFCTDLQRAGVPLNVAKELMGHADVETTANIYTHRDNAVLHAWVDRLGAKKQPGDQTGGQNGEEEREA